MNKEANLTEQKKDVGLSSGLATDTTQQKFDELKKAAEPLIKYLCENYHPHVTAIVTGTSIELLEGIMNIPEIFDYVVD